ncbi:MAG: GGDEF domain-containing protein [Solirubrobacteraceae bacterium]|nr:GGDEF domain-containing protein [Solirubrobacteraceae bacterium]
MEGSPSTRPSWLCRDQFERERFLDMHERLLPAHSRIMLGIAALLLPVSPWMTPASLVTILAAVVIYGVIQRNVQWFQRPEIAIFTAMCVCQVLIATAVVLNGSQHEGGLALLAWPAVAIGGRFAARVMYAGTAFTAAVIVGASLLFDGGAVATDPLVLVVPLVVLWACVMISATVRESDNQHRKAAVLDQLTGLLNRTALDARTTELEVQSQVTGQPVAVIVADIDHFKAVNDTHGHATGDAVLRDLTYAIRSELRAFDLAYRLGGEEFVILLAGATVDEAAQTAEQLRRVVEARSPSGLEVTMSFGVAASAAGQQFVWDEVFGRADAALYEAKRAGRNRVIGGELPVTAAA